MLYPPLQRAKPAHLVMLMEGQVLSQDSEAKKERMIQHVLAMLGDERKAEQAGMSAVKPSVDLIRERLRQRSSL